MEEGDDAPINGNVSMGKSNENSNSIIVATDNTQHSNTNKSSPLTESTTKKKLRPQTAVNCKPHLWAIEQFPS